MDDLEPPPAWLATVIFVALVALMVVFGTCSALRCLP